MERILALLRANPEGLTAAGQLPQIALIPVDAGRWKLDTSRLVQHWLQGQLPEGAVVIA